MKYTDLTPGQFFRFAEGAPYSEHAAEESSQSLCLATDCGYVSDMDTGFFAQWSDDDRFDGLDVELEPYAIARQAVAS